MATTTIAHPTRASTAQPERGRIARGLLLARRGGIVHLGGGVFFVPSATNPKTGYVVDLKGEGSCECRDHVYRKALCKHQIACRAFVAPVRARRDVEVETTMVEAA